MDSIMDLVTGVFRGETLDRLSSQLNVTRSQTEHGITQAIPIALAGLAQQAQSEQGARDLLNGIQNGNYPQIDPSNFGAMLADSSATKHMLESSSGFMNGFFGSKLGALVDMFTGSSGMSRSSASKLLGLVSPLILGWIGKQVTIKGLDARGLSRLLTDESQKVADRLPAGFGSAFTGASRAIDSARAGLRGPFRRFGWLLAALVGLGAVLLWWASRRPAEPELSTRLPELQTRLPEVRPTIPEVPLPQPVEILPVAGTDPIVIQNDASAFERFLSGKQPLPQRFVLYRLEFDTSSAQVAPNGPLNDAAKAIIAHPSTKLRIEGHTDQQGTGEDNQALSQRRADAVKSYLIARGVAESQLSAVGMSELNPLDANDTPEGRARNRRVELIVIER